MNRFAALLIVASTLPGIAGAQQQDDPLETRVFNVEFLTKEVEDHPGGSLGLDVDALGSMPSDAGPSGRFMSGEELVQIVKTNVAEESWEAAGVSIVCGAGVLTVTNAKSV